MSLPLRTIKSFVRREGRITEAQQRALRTLTPLYGLNFQNGIVNFSAVFQRVAPLHVEIGCGAGETITHLAKLHPENNYLGIEIFRPGIGRILQEIESHSLSNVRILCADASLAFECMFADKSIDALYIFFPDPWPKLRHRKRRLIQPDFLSLAQTKIKRHGSLYIATDCKVYAKHIQKTLTHHLGFISQGSILPRPHWRPQTKFEQRGIAAGRQIYDFFVLPL